MFQLAHFAAHERLRIASLDLSLVSIEDAQQRVWQHVHATLGKLLPLGASKHVYAVTVTPDAVRIHSRGEGGLLAEIRYVLVMTNAYGEPRDEIERGKLALLASAA